MLVKYFGYTLQKMRNCCDLCLKFSRVEKNSNSRPPSEVQLKSDYCEKPQIFEHMWVTAMHNNPVL